MTILVRILFSGKNKYIPLNEEKVTEMWPMFLSESELV